MKRENKRGWTTISIPQSLHEKLKKVYRAHGGKENFRNLYSFIDVMLDYVIYTDTAVLREIALWKDKKLQKHPEFKELIEELRREVSLPPSIVSSIASASSFGLVPKKKQEDYRGNSDKEAQIDVSENNIELPDINIPPHQCL